MTRAQNFLQAELDADNPDRVSIQDALADFDRRLQILDDIQTELEISLDSGDVDADIEQAADLRIRIKKIRI